MSDDIISQLIRKAENDDYLDYLLKKAENVQAYYTFSDLKLIESSCHRLSKKEVNDILRFADILSMSEKPLNKNKALKIVSLMYDKNKNKNENMYKLVSKGVLSKYGNFPSIKFLKSKFNENDVSCDEIERKLLIKTVTNESPDKKVKFTDEQIEIFNELIEKNNFSFSASTSFGKSFLLFNYIKYMIEKHNGINICFLVPTRSLINQTVESLRKLINKSSYTILVNPDVPKIFSKKNYIFVFTPERLITSFSFKNKIDILIVDEAQNIVSEDERSPLFYHAVQEAKNRKIKIYFSSPWINNPDIFFDIFNYELKDYKKTEILNVYQNKYFVDLENKKINIYEDSLNKNEKSNHYIDLKESVETCDFIKRITKDDQSIIYCNSSSKTINFAKNMESYLDSSKNTDLELLSQKIKSEIHKKYFLSNLVKKGIAYHFGALPPAIRKEIEYQFKKGNIKYLFTTSTLLQGVNLPAKNLFILDDKIGMSKIKPLQFNNLIGRAGRLSKDLYGNVFVVKTTDNKIDEKIFDDFKIDEMNINTEILTGKNKFYDKISKIILKEKLPKSLTKTKKRQLIEYSSIVTYHEKNKIKSSLDLKFKRDSQYREAKDVINNIDVPDDIIFQFSPIDVRQQQNIKNKSKEEQVDLNELLKENEIEDVLNELFKQYDWENNEIHLDIGSERRLKYYAFLLRNWIKSTPLNLIIKSVISYQSKNEGLIFINNKPEKFDETNSIHINKTINDLMKDVENVIRYKIKNYITNYLSLTNSGEDSNWKDYLNYGTLDDVIIELQKIGFDRASSIDINKNAKDCLSFNENKEIVKIDIKDIKNRNLKKDTLMQINDIFDVNES
ncbi:DEAD/DEAH box helicase [Fructilactobacillus myrtifloralis]|uniref:DEAD/DEAH box helicase n=1 Tax=Fructilactobacillus myrtifloralis TaxID=2940301 RepID=A0ABY5BPX4_9LACO|nr:DEAD/DEAH box helicase [Fructilactobacillus myrtifloralis]USS85610.1 DEAD/DEAH box helicase [Fructilactobacillus myrtifloralis]